MSGQHPLNVTMQYLDVAEENDRLRKALAAARQMADKVEAFAKPFAVTDPARDLVAEFCAARDSAVAFRAADAKG